MSVDHLNVRGLSELKGGGPAVMTGDAPGGHDSRIANNVPALIHGFHELCWCAVTDSRSPVLAFLVAARAMS